MLNRRVLLKSGLLVASMRPRDMLAGEAKERWWQSAVGYQIYPASYCDTNGDGIGDLPGIISKLDYLADLGVGFIWLSPIYQSPMVDNGYDISDYQQINPTFGTLADMDRLIEEAHKRNIRIVMDLVVNHTSDQHPWFQAAITDPKSPYRDYYIWRDAPPISGSPADLQANFGGSAWTRDEKSGAFYFHLFAPQQPDLNWANPAVRTEVYQMMRWWLARGVAGFRMDVIDLIGKVPDLGVTSNGPKLHNYLQDMHKAALSDRDIITVGEAWSATPETAPLYSALDRGELCMVFQFEQVTTFWDAKLGKWKPKSIDLPLLKASFERWQHALHEHGWNSLFWGNHDLPRAVSRYGDDGTNRVASAKMLATLLHLMEGTPFIFQGEEIGMTNARFTSIEQYRDLETINLHRIQMADGVTEADFLTGARANSRDNARTPMQWSADANAGFTTGDPWISLNSNYHDVNVTRDRADPMGVFARYRELIALRRKHRIIRHGDFRLILADHAQIFAFERRFEKTRLFVLCNFSGTPAAANLPNDWSSDAIDLFTGRSRRLANHTTLAPYETVVLLLG